MSDDAARAEVPVAARSEAPDRAPRGLSNARLTVELLLAGILLAALIAPTSYAIIDLSREAILRDKEQELRTYALLAAGRIDGDDLKSIRTPADMDKPEFRRVHNTITRIAAANPELRYVYTMRYTGQGLDWETIVDRFPYAIDIDADGVIEDNEVAQPPGTIYTADEAFQERMLAGLEHSETDMEPVDDPPWGYLVSAYAPVYDSEGNAVAIFGIDMAYERVVAKLDGVAIAVFGLSVMVGFLMLYGVYLVRRRTQTVLRLRTLQRELVAIGSIYSKFVPERVRRELETHPDGSSLQRRELDVTVMFVDVAGYTKLSERLPTASIPELLERYFSRYLEVIHHYGGQVNETAGDGIMVIFEQDAPNGHALDAVRAAIEIQRATDQLNRDPGTSPEDTTSSSDDREPTLVNIGINSGPSFVGLNRFVGVTGERYTYTATGTTTNVAARVAGLARNGDILLSEITAKRVSEEIETERVGRRTLKNVAAPMMIHRPVGIRHSGRVDPLVSGDADVARDPTAS